MLVEFARCVFATYRTIRFLMTRVQKPTFSAACSLAERPTAGARRKSFGNNHLRERCGPPGPLLAGAKSGKLRASNKLLFWGGFAALLSAPVAIVLQWQAAVTAPLEKGFALVH
jgi:hypothetical protein